MIEKFVKIESKIRPFIIKNYPKFSVRMYSNYRSNFLKKLIESDITKIEINPASKENIWDIDFNCNLFNSAGMFKSGEGYNLVYNQGAGAFLTGTTTASKRKGNSKNNVIHPFAPLPHSLGAINWMGLPNESHEEVARIISKIDKKKYCPIGASISSDTECSEEFALEGIIKGLEIYDKAKVDFIEFNESCPNVAHHENEDKSKLDQNLLNRLDYVNDKFLRNRKRNLPVILKLSVDTNLELIPELIDILVELDFDGVNFGNTSKEYQNYARFIDNRDLNIFNYFKNTFGGGLSGRPLKNDSLNCCRIANQTLEKINLKKEFIVIRTGGVENKIDLDESKKVGVRLNQWFSGYFEQLSLNGHKLYKEIFDI